MATDISLFAETRKRSYRASDCANWPLTPTPKAADAIDSALTEPGYRLRALARDALAEPATDCAHWPLTPTPDPSRVEIEPGTAAQMIEPGGGQWRALES